MKKKTDKKVRKNINKIQNTLTLSKRNINVRINTVHMQLSVIYIPIDGKENHPQGIPQGI